MTRADFVECLRVIFPRATDRQIDDAAALMLHCMDEERRRLAGRMREILSAGLPTVDAN